MEKETRAIIEQHLDLIEARNHINKQIRAWTSQLMQNEKEMAQNQIILDQCFIGLKEQRYFRSDKNYKTYLIKPGIFTRIELLKEA